MKIEAYQQAAELVKKYLNITGLKKTTLDGADVHLKLENQQVTGSFKARGALIKIASLSDEGRQKGVVTASTGNHGMGVANACRVLDVNGKVYLPEIVVASKHNKLKNLGIDTELLGQDSLETEIKAGQLAREKGQVWISPYNDEDIVVGQGTVAIEILEQHPEVQRVFVTVGGGGLISGIGQVIKALKPEVEVIGCQPLNSPEMYASIKAGTIIAIDEPQQTLSDGSAGGVEEDSITYEICKNVVDRWELVTEVEIERAIRLAHAECDEVIEGAAGVALAAWLRDVDKTLHDVVVICGGNIDPDLWNEIISKPE